ncbi:MAG: hypothetical protein M1832_006298 [Thelocarpon impressellum]|nr:MAG: hypothetical protein M1832_006298 [Thelocarpon impressellum]
MYPPRLPPLRRVHPLIRSLQLPTTRLKPPHPRAFSPSSQVLFLTRVTTRPQLPFLSPVSPTGGTHSALQRQRGQQWQISRLLTTERRRYLKEQIRLSGKILAVNSALIVFGLVIAFGLNNEWLERKYPSPREWTMVSRMNFRSARWNEEPDANGTGLVDWARTGNTYRELIKRLENPTKDGTGLKEQDEGGILVAGVGKTGFDIEGKPYPWRRGYYQTLRGAARAAENLDGWVRDTTRNIAFPSEVVIGPSNPRPRPCPPGAATAPREEDCEAAFEHPETYYMKILTTKGFSTQERLEAALAYADWLEFKDLPSTAEAMYRWGLDIATSAYPEPGAIVDHASGVIKSDASSSVSPNVLVAATSLATHHARTSDFSAAVPIFLSVLRARRSLLPPSPTPPSPLSAPRTPDEGATSTTSSIFSFVRSLIIPPPYPPAPPSGDAAAVRTTASVCDEAGIMAHIGEVLFASSSSPNGYADGLAWTRDAVDTAEATLNLPPTGLDREALEKCSECLDVGLANWRTMVGKLAREEQHAPGANSGGSSSSGWGFWTTAERADRARWEREMEVVEERRRRVKAMRLDERLVGAAGKGWSAVLFG